MSEIHHPKKLERNMPSSIREKLDRELRVRGGVTLGLGPLLAKTFGTSDLRRELIRRLRQGCETHSDACIREALLLNLSLGALFSKRDLVRVVDRPEVAELVVRCSLARDPSGLMLKQLQAEVEQAPEFHACVSRFAFEQDAPENIVSLFVAPRVTHADAGKKVHVGRNESCPCGSGKKFKKCHMGSEEHVGCTDAPGSPGLTPSEVFWFRDYTDELGRLCHKRLSSGGPRAGETLFWPIELAPADEIPLRLSIATDNVDALAAVLERGIELGCLTESDATDAIRAAFPPNGWFTGEFYNWLRKLPETRAKSLSVFGPWSVFDVVELRKARATELNGLIAALVDTGHALDDACALAVAGHDRLAYVAIQMVSSCEESLSREQTDLFDRLERELAPRFGRKPAGLRSRHGQAEERSNMVALESLQRRILDLKREVDRERELRQRIQSAWSNDERTSGEDTLRVELRRLREELKAERQTAREALKDVQQFRQRERIRLLEESPIEADVVAALVDSADVDAHKVNQPSEIIYSEEFEAVVNRIPSSTLARLREQITTFASGGRVREAKRMEALEGVWTLRAGLHYRAILRRCGSRVDVMSLIPREDLDNTLARLRR